MPDLSNSNSLLRGALATSCGRRRDHQCLGCSYYPELAYRRHAHYYYNLDTVTFDNTGSLSPAVNLGVAVTPAATIVNSSNDYTIEGAGKLTGGGTVTKRGTGTLTVSTINDYSGLTTVEAGTLQIGSATATTAGV